MLLTALGRLRVFGFSHTVFSGFMVLALVQNADKDILCKAVILLLMSEYN
uniref:Uncharacterized protein n=1 Tax=Manihot esculenta TaxID=3983 RepID=A0A2C9UW68_MANES